MVVKTLNIQIILLVYDQNLSYLCYNQYKFQHKKYQSLNFKLQGILSIFAFRINLDKNSYQVEPSMNLLLTKDYFYIIRTYEIK